MNPIAIPEPIWDSDFPATRRAGPDWLLHGFIARGYATLLTSQWKAGKTTLLSMLLSRRVTGGTLAGLAVAPGNTAVISEEHRDIWADRAARCNFGGNVCFFCQPFLGLPSPADWQALINRVLAEHQSRGLTLVAIDALGPFLRAENNAQAILEALLPLQAFTRARMAVLLVHHPRKGTPPLGQAARGSGALLGHVDISIEMRHPGGDPLTRRRRLFSLSRFTDTPRQLLLELNADGTDYVPVADALIDDFEANWQVVRLVLDDAPQKLTRRDILGEWPDDFDKPAPATLHRWLRRAVERNLLLVEGTGRKADPLRYWLAETEAKWRERSPFYDHFLQQERDLKIPFKSLQDRKRDGWTDAIDDASPPRCE